MSAGLARLALCLGVAVCAGFAFVPVGCGGSEAPGGATVAGDGTPELPGRTAQQLADCLLSGSPPFPPAEGDRYPVDFRVKVSSGGEVIAVDVKHSALKGHGVEACMGGVLLGMTLPMRPIAMERRYGAPWGRDRSRVAPEERALLAQGAAVLSPVSLLPVIIAGAGIIVVVTVIVYVTSGSGRSTTVAPPEVTAVPAASAVPSETADPVPPAAAMATAKPKATAAPTVTGLPIALPKPIATAMPSAGTAADEDIYEKRCWPLYQKCLRNPKQPAWNRKDFGADKDCKSCYQECKFHIRPRGTWPDYKCPQN